MPAPTYFRRGLFMPWELDAILGPGDDAARLASARPAAAHRERAARGGPSFWFCGKPLPWKSGLYMRNQLLRDADWASMAHSLEVRVPLVDAVLLAVETAAVLGSRTAMCPSVSRNRRRDFRCPSNLIENPSDPKTGFTQHRSRPGCRVTVGSSTGKRSRLLRLKHVLGRDGGLAKSPRSRPRSGARPNPMATSSLRVLALVTDAFGGHGGIELNHNRDFDLVARDL